MDQFFSLEDSILLHNFIIKKFIQMISIFYLSYFLWWIVIYKSALFNTLVKSCNILKKIIKNKIYFNGYY